MKLLLTSSGITNKSIAKALEELIGKSFSQTRLAFIPTAANVGGSDKRWLIKDLNNCIKLGLESLDIVDFSAIPQADWQPRIEQADVLLFSGGNSFHLMYCINKIGFKPYLQDWLKTKVYVGISAGSVVATKDFALSNQQKRAYDESIGEEAGEKALGYVDFYIRPHFNNPDFPHASKDNIMKAARQVKESIYAIDDNSALEIFDNKVTVVSEGQWERFN